MSPAVLLFRNFHRLLLFLFGILALRTAHALPAGDVTTGQDWTLFPLTLSHTMVTPAGDTLHLSHQGYTGVPVVTVLVEVLPKLAVTRSVCLHHVSVHQEGFVFLRTFLTAV